MTTALSDMFDRFSPSSWEFDAACWGLPSTWWFPPVSGSGTGLDHRQAKRICRTCPVRVRCVARAVGEDHRYGNWGDVPIRDRVKIRRRWQAEGGDLSSVVEAHLRREEGR